MRLLVLIVLIIGCTKDVQKSAQTLNYALTSKVSTIDPAMSYDTVSSKVVYQIYETLYEYNYLIRPYQLKPLLAKEMPQISNDGLTYTIKIKQNIPYQKNTIFKGKKRFVKAQDFINQFKRIAFIPTNSTGWWLFDGKIQGINDFRNKVGSDSNKFLTENISGLITPDDHTLIIKLTNPYPQLVNALAMAFTTPIPVEAVKEFKGDFNNNTVGTGPYILKDWFKGSSIKLVRNHDYPHALYPSNGDRFSYENNLLEDTGKQIPFIEEINFHIITESQTRWLNFLKNKIDFITLTKDHFSVALDSSGKLSKELTGKNIKLQIAPTLTYWWLAFNMQDPIVGKNKNLRMSFAHAVNIEEYINTFTHNIALKANSIYPPGVLGYTPQNELPYKYDVKLAKKYLADAGYPEGKGLPVFNYDVRGSSSVARQMGEFIKAELDKIGIKLKVNINTFPGFLAKSRTGRLQIWQGGWAMDYPDPENVIQLLISKNQPPGPNTSYYSHPKVDKLYQDLFKATNKEQVLGITRRIQDIVNNDLPWVMQFYSRNYILYHGKLKNFRESDLINNNIKYLRLE